MEPEKNRRGSRRRSAKRSAKVICHANVMGLGPNVAQSLLDVSESGARLKVKVALLTGQEVEVNLCGVGHRRPVKVLATVVWCFAIEDGLFLAGLKFQPYLSYTDLQELGS